MGTTKVLLSASGNTPDVKEWLKRARMCGARISTHSYKTFGGMLSDTHPFER